LLTCTSLGGIRVAANNSAYSKAGGSIAIPARSQIQQQRTAAAYSLRRAERAKIPFDLASYFGRFFHLRA
jgi:hypothetical protein